MHFIQLIFPNIHCFVVLCLEENGPSMGLELNSKCSTILNKQNVDYQGWNSQIPVRIANREDPEAV